MNEDAPTRQRSKSKRGLNAPCMYLDKNPETGILGYRYPDVDCEQTCDTCGWNPKVKLRRLGKTL